VNSPFDYLAALLEHLHARSPLAAYLVALALAVACTIALAYLNQDGTSVTSNLVRTA